MGTDRRNFLRMYVQLEQAELSMERAIVVMLDTATMYEKAGRGSLALSIREHASELKGEAKL